MSHEAGALLVEPCARCGRAQTLVRTTAGELHPVCMCCGGGGLERDRMCRHHAEQAELRLAPALICQQCGHARESAAQVLCDACRTAKPPA